MVIKTLEWTILYRVCIDKLLFNLNNANYDIDVSDLQSDRFLYNNQIYTTLSS